MCETSAKICEGKGPWPGYELARQLEAFAERRGFVAPSAHYIRGEFSLKDADGNSVYSDEAHLWCEGCAEKLLAKAHALMPESEREDHFVCYTDAYCEDTCPHCMDCGETLRGTVSEYCLGEELAYYAEHPIAAGEKINPRQAVELAMVLSAAPENVEALAVGHAALAAIQVAEAA